MPVRGVTILGRTHADHRGTGGQAGAHEAGDTDLGVQAAEPGCGQGPRLALRPICSLHAQSHGRSSSFSSRLAKMGGPHILNGPPACPLPREERGSPRGQGPCLRHRRALRGWGQSSWPRLPREGQCVGLTRDRQRAQPERKGADRGAFPCPSRCSALFHRVWFWFCFGGQQSKVR